MPRNAKSFANENRFSYWAITRSDLWRRWWHSRREYDKLKQKLIINWNMYSRARFFFSITLRFVCAEKQKVILFFYNFVVKFWFGWLWEKDQERANKHSRNNSIKSKANSPRNGRTVHEVNYRIFISSNRTDTADGVSSELRHTKFCALYRLAHRPHSKFITVSIPKIGAQRKAKVKNEKKSPLECRAIRENKWISYKWLK